LASKNLHNWIRCIADASLSGSLKLVSIPLRSPDDHNNQSIKPASSSDGESHAKSPNIHVKLTRANNQFAKPLQAQINSVTLCAGY